MSDPMQTFCDEADAFRDRNRAELDELGETATAFGTVTWGLMRALAECPDCPGTFRTPIGTAVGADAFDVLRCPRCERVWATAQGRKAIDAREAA
jgi:hypothetical protein